MPAPNFSIPQPGDLLKYRVTLGPRSVLVLADLSWDARELGSDKLGARFDVVTVSREPGLLSLEVA